MELVKCVESCYGFEETVERIKDASERRGWKVVNVLDLRENLGKDIVIVEICKEEFARKVLESEEMYWISAMMPCRFGICRQKNGVFVYEVNMETFAQMIGGEVKEVLSKVAEDEIEILKEIQK